MTFVYPAEVLSLIAKAIACARNCQKQVWVRGVGFDLSSQLTDVDMEKVSLLVMVSSPHLGEEHPRRHNLATIFDQHLEQVILGRSELHLIPVHRNVPLR